MNYRELIHLGLTEKEARVYLAALELGKSSVQNIAKKADINRATAYVIIDILIKKGLMSSIEESKKQFYYAEPPEKLKLLFEDQEREIIRKLDYLDKLLPELRALNNLMKEKPTVRYFEGKEGLKSIAEELSTYDNEPVRMAYSLDLIQQVFSEDETKAMRKKRIEQNIKTKVLYNSKNKILKSTQDGERVRIDEKEFPITCDIALFGKDKIRIAALQGKIVGLIIENREIYRSLKSILDLAVIGAKSLEKKEGQDD
jgi:HTH-type transcriptional regulator, sugar sensing transcriptional regulator